jgi:predicted nucleic acid-binding protein
LSGFEPRCVVDASALILLAQSAAADPRAELAHRALPALHESHGLGAPAMLAWELAQVVHRKRADEWATTGDRQRVVQLLLEGIVLVAPEPQRLARAGRIAEELGLSVYDASYLEMAESDGATLLTEDARLARAAQRLLGESRVLDLAAAASLEP